VLAALENAVEGEGTVMRKESVAGKNGRKNRKLAHAVALRLACASFFAVMGFGWSPVASATDVAADALPTRGRVAAGEATIGDAEKDAAGKIKMMIDQTSRRAIIDWATFNVGKDATLTFQTWAKDAAGVSIIDPTAMTLNRVTASGGLSTIAGRIISTGVFLLQNPNGVLFAEGSAVDAAGIVATTAAIDATQFMNEGTLTFVQDKQAPNAFIIVHGTLTAHTDVAQAKALLDQTALKVDIPIATALSVENNVIRLVAEGDIHVGKAGKLQATSTVTYTDELGDTATRDGTIVLRADANADEVHGKVVLENANASQISAQHVIVQFKPDQTDGTKDYAKGAAEAAALERKFAASKDHEVAMLVNDAHELQAIESHLDGSYALGTDIEAAETSGWNDGKGFAPIGSAAAPFQGAFDGNGYRIYDLTIQRGDADDVGLFGVADGARIANTTLADPIVCGKKRVGGLVGCAKGKTVLSSDVVRKRDGSAREGETRTGTLENVFSGSSNVLDGSNIGGLVGKLDGSTICGFSQNAATVKGTSAVGGLAGWAVNATITDSSNTGYTSAQTNLANGQKAGVITATFSNVGGLVGHAEQTFIGAKDARTATYNDGRITGEGCFRVGGLVGWLEGSKLTQAYNVGVSVKAGSPEVGDTYGSVTGKMDVGGITGDAGHDSEITTVFHSGNVTGITDVGGIAGSAGCVGTMTISRAYSGEGNIAGRTDVGGLVGLLDNGKITEAYNLSKVMGVQDSDTGTVGLLVGEQGKKGIIGTKKEDAVYYVRFGDDTNAPTKPVGTASWAQICMEEHTPEELKHAETIGWKHVSATLSDASQTWFLKEGEEPLQLRALVQPARFASQNVWEDVPMEVIPADEVAKGEISESGGSSGGDSKGGVPKSENVKVRIPSTETRTEEVPLHEIQKEAPLQDESSADPDRVSDDVHGAESMNVLVDLTYEFTIHDHHRTWLDDMDENISQAAIVSLPRYDARAHFFTLEGTVLHPIEKPLFGGAQLLLEGTAPFATGTTIATASPDLVLEAAEDSGEKAGNSTSHSE